MTWWYDLTDWTTTTSCAARGLTMRRTIGPVALRKRTMTPTRRQPPQRPMSIPTHNVTMTPTTPNEALKARAKALKLYGLLVHWQEIDDLGWVERLIQWEERGDCMKFLSNNGEKW